MGITSSLVGIGIGAALLGGAAGATTTYIIEKRRREQQHTQLINNFKRRLPDSQINNRRIVSRYNKLY